MDLKDLIEDIFPEHEKQPGAGVDANAVATPPASPAQPLALTPGNLGRTLLIHGYSAQGSDLVKWHDKLLAMGIPTLSVEVGNYITLDNEVTIKDLGEAFDRALRFTPWGTGSRDDNWTFDAVVHSTGMLVLRQWLASDPYDRDDARSRVRRLKHLVGIAPATFGSPQAKEGRSWLGALVKGNRHPGPDFLNAGNLVLDGLELGSKFNWDLTHKDMVCPKPLFDQSTNTPYAAVFIGNCKYAGIAAFVSPPGSDGTVRWAGCALNTRKVSVDFRREPKLKDTAGIPVKDADGNPARFHFTPWLEGRLDAPMIAVEGKNHGTIVSDPDPDLADFIGKFFKIATPDQYDAWQKDVRAFGAKAQVKMDEDSAEGDFGGAGWQQLMVHVVDDHGDAVNDYNLQIYIGDNLTDSDLDENDSSKDPIRPIPLIADTYSSDGSYRCFYIRISPAMLKLNTPEGEQKKMWLELIASSGSDFIEYEAYTGQPGTPQSLTINHQGGSAVKLDITGLAQGTETLLFPYTTTLLEIFVEREPLPLQQVSKLFNFLGYDGEK